MIMSDKRLKVCLRGAAVFLAVSIVFCIAVICGVNIQKSNMEKQRLDTETKLAEMQMPTFAPQSTEEVKNEYIKKLAEEAKPSEIIRAYRQIMKNDKQSLFFTRKG